MGGDRAAGSLYPWYHQRILGGGVMPRRLRGGAFTSAAGCWLGPSTELLR